MKKLLEIFEIEMDQRKGGILNKTRKIEKKKQGSSQKQVKQAKDPGHTCEQLAIQRRHRI